MLTSAEQIIECVLAASVFGLVLSLWVGALLVWSGRRRARRQRLERRLRRQGGEASEERVLRLWHDGRDETMTVPAAARSGSLLERLDRGSRRAGWSVGGEVILLLAGGGVMTAAVVTLFATANPLLALGVSAAVLVVFGIYFRHRIERRDALFERQFADALALAARSLRAGHPLTGAFQLVSEEMSSPVRDVFSGICQQHQLGADLETTLRDAAERASSPDMRLFATSVAIQIRSGGNLAALMDRIAAVIRERIRLSRRVRILTAQTQLSKRVLIVLPFVVFVVFNVLNPDYMRPLFTTLPGKLMLAAGVLLLAMGAWVMNRMAVLKY